MQSFDGSTVFIFERFLSWQDCLCFKQMKENAVSTISKVCDCKGGIELAERRLSLDKRIQAGSIRNVVETVRQLKKF